MKSKVFRIVCLVFCCVSLVLAPTLCYKKLTKAKGGQKGTEYKCILNVWHVDTFGGGFGSRKKFIESVAKTFEKKRTGVLVRVTDMTLTTLNESLKTQTPDVISYGVGANVDVTKLAELSEPCGKGGVIKGKPFAAAWARNCYFLISKKGKVFSGDDVVRVGTDECNFPVLSLCLNGYLNPVEYCSSEKAYQAFIYGKTDFFVGTLKDIYRLNKRGIEYDKTILNGFDDMLQYVSAYKTDNLAFSSEFIDALVGVGLRKLNDGVGLCKENGDNLIGLEEKPSGEYKTLSAFTSYDVVKVLQNSVMNARGEKEILNILKNSLL